MLQKSGLHSRRALSVGAYAEMIDRNVSLETRQLYLVHLSLAITSLELTACYSSAATLQTAVAL